MTAPGVSRPGSAGAMLDGIWAQELKELGGDVRLGGCGRSAWLVRHEEVVPIEAVFCGVAESCRGQ